MRADERTENDRADHSENETGRKRKGDFPQIIRSVRETFLDLAVQENAPANDIKDRVANTGKQQVAKEGAGERKGETTNDPVHGRKIRPQEKSEDRKIVKRNVIPRGKTDCLVKRSEAASP